MRSIGLGAMRIHRVAEIDRMSLPFGRFFIGAAPDLRGRDWLDGRLIDPATGDLIISFHSFVIECGKRRILIDTCHGDGKRREGDIAYANGLRSGYLDNLSRIGLKPDDIDIVLCTHLHYDHVGWNTRLENGRWVPTFSNARYLMTQTDFDYLARMPDGSAASHHLAAFRDSVLPVVEAGQAQMIDHATLADCDLADGLRLEAAPGHTPGSIMLCAENRFGRAVVSGDVIHHPIQFADPDLHVVGEHDTALGIVTRRRLIDRLADTGALLLAAHFPAPTAGRVMSERGGFRFDFAVG